MYPQRRKAHTDLKGAPKKKKSKNQLNKLIEAFKTNHKPNRSDIINLSEQTQLPVQEVRQWFNNQRRKIKKDESNEYNGNVSSNNNTNNNNISNNNNSGNLNKPSTIINQYVQYQYTFEHSDSLLSTNSNSSLLNTYLPPSQQQQQQQQQQQSLLPPPSQSSPLPPSSQPPPLPQQQQQSSSSISNQSQQLQIQHSNVDISSNLSSSNTQSQLKNTINNNNNNNKIKKLKNVLPSNQQQQQEQQIHQQLINEKYIKTECNSFLKELKASSKLEKTCYLRYLIEGINKTDRKQMNKLLKENFENENISYGNCNNNDSNTYGSMRPYKPSSDVTLSTETHRKRSIQAWNQLAKVFGAEEEKKGGNNYDLAMFNGLKYMFSNHRDYLTELCKVYGISTFKEEYQKQMSDQEMSDEPNDKL